MKKLFAALLCLSALLWGCSCQSSPKAPPKGYAFGVIECHGTVSSLCFYDQNMKLLGEQKLPYVDVGASHSAIIKERKLYTDIYGKLSNTKGQSLSIDNISGQRTVINTKAVSALSLCMNDNALFLSNTLNFEPTATRYDIKTGSLSSYVFDIPGGAGTVDLAANGNTLYGISSYHDDALHMVSDLYEINATTLQLIKKINLPKFDNGAQMLAVSDGLYFTTNTSYNRLVTDSKPNPSFGLHYYAKGTGKVTSYRLTEGFPMALEAWGDILVIGHGSERDGKVITLFDTKTGKEVNRITLDHTIERMHVKGNQLYVMDYSYDEEGSHYTMHRYTLNPDYTLTPEAEGSVCQYGDKPSHVNCFYINEEA